MPRVPNTTNHQRVALWLLIVAAMIFVMVVLGGTTRLTRSGLSIVEWRLFEGTLPPLTEAHWQELFELYKKTPEYQKINTGMDLAGFEKIFWLEYLHRLWGRLIFFVALIPLLWFLWRGQIEKKWIPRVAVVPLLVAANGVLGWFMVASGLIDLPRVSPYRLTAHLGLALAIYGYLIWTALSLRPAPVSPSPPAKVVRLSRVVIILVFIMVLSGGFVAGNKAGLLFNTFPLMNGRFLPEGLLAMQPFWVNFFENMATVQFDHRLLAYVLCMVIPIYWWRTMQAKLPAHTRLALHLLLGGLMVQVSLGIGTLLLHVPVSLGALHQAGALVLFSLAVYCAHRLRAQK